MTLVMSIVRGRREARGQTVPISQILVPDSKGITKPVSLMVLPAHPALHSWQERGVVQTLVECTCQYWDPCPP